MNQLLRLQLATHTCTPSTLAASTQLLSHRPNCQSPQPEHCHITGSHSIAQNQRSPTEPSTSQTPTSEPEEFGMPLSPLTHPKYVSRPCSHPPSRVCPQLFTHSPTHYKFLLPLSSIRLFSHTLTLSCLFFCYVHYCSIYFHILPFIARSIYPNLIYANCPL